MALPLKILCCFALPVNNEIIYHLHLLEPEGCLPRDATLFALIKMIKKLYYL
jgi:hypothetical protein